MSVSIIYDTYNGKNNFEIIENNDILLFGDKNIKKSLNAKYNIIKYEYSSDIIININLKFGENKIDKLLYNQLNYSYRLLAKKFDLTKTINLIKYTDVDEILNNQESIYHYDGKIIIDINSYDNCIILEKNQNVILKNLKNMYNNFKKIKLNGIIIHDNNSNWIYNIDNIYKYKKKLIISENFNDVKTECITYTKIQNNKVTNLSKFELIIIDTLNINIFKLKKFTEMLNTINGSNCKIIIRIDDTFNVNHINLLFKILTNQKEFIPLFDEHYKIKYPKIYYKMEKMENKIDVKNLVKIFRIEYNLSQQEQNFINFIQQNNKICDCYDMLDSLSPLFYKKTNLNNQNNCPICMDCMEENICKTECNHYFCVCCLSLYLLNSIKCPVCRKKIKINKIDVNNFDQYSKINILEEGIKKIFYLKKDDKNILIYINNINLCKFFNDKIKNKYKTFMLYANNKLKNIRSRESKFLYEKIERINKSKNSIIIVNSKDYIYSKNIMNIGTILIQDYKYNYILNKDCLGYDCVNKKEPVNIIIYEAKKWVDIK